MTSAFIQTLSGKVSFKIPSSCQLLSIAEFNDTASSEAPTYLTKMALQAPISKPRLEEQLTSDDTVAILVEDLTRTSPKKHLLQVLLDHLEEVGISPENISIVIALGTHRALSRKELERGYGKDVVARYKFINHDCQAEDLVKIGKLSNGTAVKINRFVHEATYRIGIGSIFPHPLNGFGGGCKILFPGVADINSILEHHLKYSFVGQAYQGNLTGNDFYRTVCELAHFGKLDFIINSVLNHKDRLYEIVCGDPVKAHVKGTQICRDIVSKSFSQKSDLTVISAFPYAEGPQIMKPLASAAMITRKSGVIILVADCQIPLSEVYFEACELFQKKHADNLGDAVLKCFAANRPILENAPPELNMSLAQVLLTLNDFKVILVTSDIPEESIKRLGFIPARSVEMAILKSHEYLNHPSVHVVPSGGVILPVVD